MCLCSIAALSFAAGQLLYGFDLAFLVITVALFGALLYPLRYYLRLPLIGTPQTNRLMQRIESGARPAHGLTRQRVQQFHARIDGRRNNGRLVSARLNIGAA